MPQPAHAELSGSTAHRWIRCAGSVNLIKSLGRDKSESTPYAREGTFAHAVSAHVLRGGSLDKYIDSNELFEFDDHDEKFNWPIPTDMLEYTDVYIDRVRRHAADSRHKPYIEHHVDLSFVREGMFGTTDAGIVKPDVLVVVDLKYGYVPVFLVDTDLLLDSTYGELGHLNPQLLYYAAGLANEVGWKKIKWVDLEIVQPRSMEVPPVQTTRVRASALKDWAQNDLWKAAHAATTIDAPLAAGEWCRFCPALDACPEAQKLVGQQAIIDFADVPVSPVVPDEPERLARILHWAPYIDSWLKACEMAALQLMEGGTQINGFKLVEKKKHRVWPTQDPDELAELLGVEKEELYGKPEILAPKPMEKIAGKQVVASVAVRPQGELTIGVNTDRRPAEEAKGDFDNVL